MTSKTAEIMFTLCNFWSSFKLVIVLLIKRICGVREKFLKRFSKGFKSMSIVCETCCSLSVCIHVYISQISIHLFFFLKKVMSAKLYL